MGFFSEIINDCCNSYHAVDGSYARLQSKQNRLIGNDFAAEDNAPFGKTESFSKEYSENNYGVDQEQLETQVASKVENKINEFNTVAEANVDLDVHEDDQFDLAAELHRVQVERLQTQSRARSNVPCSEESQVISQLGGDSEEHLHYEDVNRSSIDWKLKSGAENVREKKSGSEFFESSSDVREFDEDVNNSRFDSDRSFYDREVELDMSRINKRESRSSTNVEDVNLRNSQGQRARPERLNNQVDSLEKVFEETDSRLQNALGSKNKLGKIPNQNKTDAVDTGFVDMDQIYSELKASADILATEIANIGSEDDSASLNANPATAKTKNRYRLKSRQATNPNHDVPNSIPSKNATIQPKVTIGQIDVIVTAASDPKTDVVDARYNSSLEGSTFSNNSIFSSRSSRNYSRRI